MGMGARSASAAAWAETDITGLKLFLDADTLTLGALASWPDVSGNGKHGVATGAPAAATAAGLNGQAAVAFTGDSGSNDYFTFPDLDVATSVDVFAVVLSGADPGGTATDCGFWTMGTASDSDTHPFSDGNIYDGAGSTVRKTVGNPAADLAAGHIYGVRSASGAWSAEVNGAEVHATGTNTVGFPAAPVLGKSFGVLYFEGHIAKLVVVSPQMSAGDRTLLLAKWAEQYAITLA